MPKYLHNSLKRHKPRVGAPYISNPRMPKYQSMNRSNSQVNRGKKSVSIVSLSPNDDLNYGKDIMLYNPYTRATAGKQKIHLPYLKSRRAMPKIRRDGRHSKRRVDSSVKSTSIDALTSGSKK